MKLFLSRFYYLLFPFVLVLITILICIFNYTPGTFLTGWDTLHPEFNFSQNLSNVIFGVFRSDQGLGAVAAHSHMAELPRILLLWIFSWVLDLSFLRYTYFYLCLILGPLGIYFFTKSILKPTRHQIISSCSAFLAALYYLFNLGTVQHFYVPFEMFATQYALIGFLFLFAKRHLTNPSKNSLPILAVLSFLAAPMAYASLLWYAYFAGMLLFVSTYFLLNKSKKLLKKSIILILFVLMTNAFWILPNFYFLQSAASDVPNAQSNKLFSEEAFLHNKQYGTLLDTALYRNYLFNWKTVETSQFETNPGLLLHAWQQHLANPFITVIGYFLFICVLLGIFFSIIKRNKYTISLVPVAFMAFIMIINMNPPFEFFFSYLRDNISLFKEGLRFPFTKFSILLMFSFSTFFAFFWNTILTSMTRSLTKVLSIYISVATTLIFSIIFIIYGFPMFKGELIYKNLRVEIPSSYFELYTWMKDKPNDARIAPLPIHSLWGWEYYNWGFQGAGFTWFGLSQPYLARDFDRWNISNEQYYREMSTALYARDIKAVENIARKYQIHYFLLDESVISPGDHPNLLWIRETKNTFNQSNSITLEKQFGDLSLYSVNLPEKTNTFLLTPKEFTTVGPELTGGFRDQASQDFSTYLSTPQPSFLYPARNLIDRYGRISYKNIFLLSDDKLILTFKDSIPNSYTINADWLRDSIFPDSLKEQEDKLEQEFQSTLYKIGSTLFMSMPISSEKHSVVNEIQQNFDCVHPFTNTPRLKRNNNFVELSSLGGETCAYMVFPHQNLDLGQLIIIKAKNITGIPLRMCITENISRKCDIYTALEKDEPSDTYYYVVPPFPSGLNGYVVHFNNVSIGNTPSVNTIESIQAITIPYYRIQNVKLDILQSSSSIQNDLSISNIKTKNPVTIQFAAQGNGLVMFTKAYNSGWHLYSSEHTILSNLFPFIFATEVKTHVPVNSWANGWEINAPTTTHFTVIFLPQYFEYIGLIISIGSVSGIIASLLWNRKTR